MRLEGKHNGHDVIAYPLRGSYESPSLGNTRFSSAEMLQRALDRIDSEAAKDFTNRTAYLMPSWRSSEVAEVVVTSIRGEEAWIVGKDGRRQKVQLSALCESAADVHAFLDIERECDARVKGAREAIPRWKPQKGA